MTVTGLLNQLTLQGVDNRIIYTGEGNPEDRFAIIYEGHIWSVYYSERGAQLELQKFFSEREACEYLVNLLMKDQTVRDRGFKKLEH